MLSISLRQLSISSILNNLVVSSFPTTITSKLTNVLSQLNPNEFLNKIKGSKDVNECLETSKKFCEHITNIKGQILFDIPEELSSLIQKDKLIYETNNSLLINNNGNNIDIKNNSFKNILASFKLKVFNLNANISELNINLNNISSNLKKHKYSLATKRIENLIKIKDNMIINVNFLENIRNHLYDNINSFNFKNTNDNKSKKKLILTKSPSLIKERKNSKNLSTIQLSNKKNLKKNSSTNKVLNIYTKKYNTIENKRNSRSSNCLTINTTPKRYTNKMQISKFNNTISNFDNKNNLNDGLTDKEKDELIIKLKSEIESLNQKNKSIFSNDKNQSLQLNLEKDVLLFFNEKLSKISDQVFSITFLISDLQNKFSQISSEKELNEINNNLMQMTSNVSEIKTKILKMSIENKNIFIPETNTNKNDNIQIIDESLYQIRIKSLQSENQNLKCLIEELNIKINSLNEKITSSKSENSEIFSLKEKLNQSEKKISEIKNIYEADLSSKTLIENLLQKNLEEQKNYYEDKISKLNKKIEEINKESKFFSISREDNLKILKNDDIFSLKEINSSFANEINSIKNVMSNNNDLNKFKNEITELNEKIAKKDKEIICLITNANKEKKSLTEKYEKEKEDLTKEINKLKLIIGNNKDIYENGGEIQLKNNNEKNEKIIFKNIIKIREISLDFKSNLILTIEKREENDNFSDEEDDEDTDEEFIIKIKKLNETKINDNYQMKSYKKENRKLIHRYEDALDENHELKKKMILIEEIVINKQNELYNNLKKGFKDLLLFLSINNKSKGKIIYFLNLIQFSEQEIKLIIGKKK